MNLNPFRRRQVEDDGETEQETQMADDLEIQDELTGDEQEQQDEEQKPDPTDEIVNRLYARLQSEAQAQAEAEKAQREAEAARSKANEGKSELDILKDQLSEAKESYDWGTAIELTGKIAKMEAIAETEHRLAPSLQRFGSIAERDAFEQATAGESPEVKAEAAAFIKELAADDKKISAAAMSNPKFAEMVLATADRRIRAKTGADNQRSIPRTESIGGVSSKDISRDEAAELKGMEIMYKNLGMKMDAKKILEKARRN